MRQKAQKRILCINSAFAVSNNRGLVFVKRMKYRKMRCGFVLAGQGGGLFGPPHIAQMEDPEYSVLNDWATKLVLKAKDYTEATSESISR